MDNPTLTPRVDAAFTSGLIDTLQPTSLQLTQALLGGSFPVSDATLLSPWADLVNDFTSGHLLAAIGDPIAADVALIPFALFLGAGALADAVEGTLLNIENLIP